MNEPTGCNGVKLLGYELNPHFKARGNTLFFNSQTRIDSSKSSDAYVKLTWIFVNETWCLSPEL